MKINGKWAEPRSCATLFFDRTCLTLRKDEWNRQHKRMFKTALQSASNAAEIEGLDLAPSFEKICLFLQDNPASFSWRGKKKPSLDEPAGLSALAEKYIRGYTRSDFPAQPGTKPDSMVGIVMQVAYGYSAEECDRIKKEHQHSMCAENCVGALLERYLDSELRQHGWVWCCGDFVKSIDFIFPKKSGWQALQVKNRDNSENSSSSSVRQNTDIQKWFRTFSKTGKFNWDNLPMMMRDKGLNEDGFILFVKNYLEVERQKIENSNPPMLNGLK